MAKSKQPTNKDFINAIHKAIASVPGVDDLSESEYCEIVGGAVDVIAEGIKMREEELDEEDK